MGLRVDFNTPIDGGNGRRDLMRVLAHSYQDANDFGAGVIFSSAFQSAQTDEFTATISGLTGQSTSRTGSFTPSRRFGAYPFVFASHHQDNGDVIFPYFFNQVYSRPAAGGNGGVVVTLERQDCLQIDTVDLGGGNYRVDYVLYNFGPGAPLRDGILRVRIVGKGA